MDTVREVASPSFFADYDPYGDVLRLVMRTVHNSESETVGEGIEIDYDVETSKAVGVTVFGFRKKDWASNIIGLYEIVDRYFSLDKSSSDRAIGKALASSGKMTP